MEKPLQAIKNLAASDVFPKELTEELLKVINKYEGTTDEENPNQPQLNEIPAELFKKYIKNYDVDSGQLCILCNQSIKHWDKTRNDLEELTQEKIHGLSYAAACSHTNATPDYGVSHDQNGFEVFYASTSHGDGTYNIYRNGNLIFIDTLSENIKKVRESKKTCKYIGTIKTPGAHLYIGDPCYINEENDVKFLAKVPNKATSYEIFKIESDELFKINHKKTKELIGYILKARVLNPNK